MTLSPSGFRKVFAVSGNKEDSTDEVAKEDLLIVTGITEAFIDKIELNEGNFVLLARDARPTGSIICETICKILKRRKIQVCYAGVCSAPEAFAESTYGEYKCFIYVSASHNPVGYNGIKAGSNGAVFESRFCKEIISALKDKMKNVEALKEVYENASSEVCIEDHALKQDLLNHYADFIGKTFDGADRAGFKAIKEKIKKLNIGVVADLNGSARCVSIDKSFLTSLGIKTAFINDTCGKIAHGIVPEGENLEPCKELLEKMHAEDPSYILGYMPDNDGDRGNLVYINKDGHAEILKAQEVFALCVYSLLSVYKDKNPAVVVNCCTSRRIEDIAERFGAEVYRTEVGEPNVVSAAELLKGKGVFVPVLGEGSNGGNIVSPAKVRDPLNTLMCMMLLLERGPVYEAIASLPKYTTTDAYFEDGVMHIWDIDFDKLKYEYIDNFKWEFKHKKGELSAYGIEKYRISRTHGIKEDEAEPYARNEDIENMSLEGSVKAYLTDKNDNFIAYIWLRPSGTEPLLRVLVDVRGDGVKERKLHDILLQWQRSMIEFIVNYIKT